MLNHSNQPEGGSPDELDANGPTVGQSGHSTPGQEYADIEQMGDSIDVSALGAEAGDLGAGPQVDAGASGDSAEVLAARLAEAEAEVLKLKDAVVRTQAEMENLRRRASRDVENAHKFALEKFVEALVPVKDAIDLGLTAASQATDVESLREGVAMTARMFDDMLGKIGVDEVNPEGERFDPELHQAMTMIESAEHASGTVVTVMQKGFTLNGRLIRPAMVGVSKASS